jgi:hypothetical protein
VCRRNKRHQPFFARGRQRLQVTGQNRLERLIAFPVGIQRRHCLDAIEHEGELNVHGLLAP